jgi:hypothetical protein
MSIIRPPKLLAAKIKFGTMVENSFFTLGPSESPIHATASYPDSFSVDMEVYPQYHSSQYHLTGTYSTDFRYTAYDIKVDDWWGTADGKVYRIKQIVSVTSDADATLIIEDKELFNLVNDSTQNGNNVPQEDQYGIIVELGQDGLPIVTPISQQSGFLPDGREFWLKDLTERFRYRNYVFDYYSVDPDNQSYTGFSIGDYVYLSESGKYEKITNANKDSVFTKTFGIVTYIESDPGRISVRPFGRVVKNLETPLPGATGSLVYFDPSGTYSLTSTKPAAYILPTYIKISPSVGLLLNNHPSYESSGGGGGTGATGIGFQGPQGYAGDQGFQGFQGLDGLQGWQGLQGFQGLDGLQGWQGFQGWQGLQGEKGDQGFQGLQGFQGWQGIDGAQGPQAAGTEISVIDYNSGVTISNVQNIVFRGGIVNVPGGTAMGVMVNGVSPTVYVWIPGTVYTPYFSPTLGSGASTRYVSSPTTNSYTSSVVSGQYSVGTWSAPVDFASSITRNVTNSSGLLTAFSGATFGCYTNTTTLSFYLYSGDGATLSSINNFILSAVGSTSSNGLTISVTAFTTDSDRYKANVTGTIGVGTIFPNGGRFSWRVIHNNSEGPGSNNNGSVTPGVYDFTQTTPVFYDNDGSVSSARIAGGVSFDELGATVSYYSGVAYYRTTSTFTFTASNINLLNDESFPTTNQITLSFTNLPITGSYPGYADGTKAAGAIITGWTSSWNSSSLTYSRTLVVNSANSYVPNFGSTANNLLASSVTSSVTATIFDYGTVGTSQSTARFMLFDTFSPSSVTFNNNPLDSEVDRLSATNVFTNGSATFSSTDPLPEDELQYIFGRVIFPQSNFTTYFPMVNLTAPVNYSSVVGATKSFVVYLDPLTGSGATTSLTFTDYRWHVTSYGKDAGYSTTFTNGIFTLNSSFREPVLAYDGVNSTAGTNDLVLLVGIDSTSSNLTPDRFLYMSGDPVTYGARSNPITYNLNNSTESSKTIQWTKGTLSPVVKKVWLFIGYKNSATGKNLRVTNISFA